MYLLKHLYIITGACGHLGSTIIRMLKKKDVEIRGLILPSEHAENGQRLTYYSGDVRIKDSLRPMFEHTNNSIVTVIHTAGLIDISEKVSKQLYDVNVNGTKNIISLCKDYSVNRLVYVSSVHAIPEKNKNLVLNEISNFSPQTVTGGYAKTKAAATQAVLAAAQDGLNAVVVQPSGIIGPYDTTSNHLVQLISDYVKGKLPACVKGGYDFVDVRDVAVGCLAAAEKGKKGECYILSNRHYEIKDVLQIVKTIYGGRKLPVLPMWMAKAAVPFMQAYAKTRKIRPLYTKYSLYTLSCNDKFSHDKATAELGYRPRDLYNTVKDTVNWLKKQNKTAQI